MFALRLDEEVAKVIDDNDGKVDVTEAMKALAPEIARTVSDALSLDDLAEALPELVDAVGDVPPGASGTRCAAGGSGGASGCRTYASSRGHAGPAGDRA